MIPGQGSKTAILVCMARAVAHGRRFAPRFSDPTALALLPDGERQRVERHLAGHEPRTLRERAERAFLDRRAQMMVVRTVEIDDAVRAAAGHVRQVVILGAGLDGRAWRMAELGRSVVFEVDHPDTQREKRARATALEQAAGEVRFVPVDFTRDRLDDALGAAGHDPAAPTTWVWEGVVMYLDPADVAATLTIVGARSAARSRLVVLYTAPALIATIVGAVVKRLGEPFRSAYTAAAMRALLERHGLAVVRDENVPALAAAMGQEIAAGTRVMKHLRVATADRI